MRASDALSLVGTIRTIDLATVTSRFKDVATREVCKIMLELEAAHNVDGVGQDLETLGSLEFVGPAELVGRFAPGERVAIETAGGIRIASIRPAPVS